MMRGIPAIVSVLLMFFCLQPVEGIEYLTARSTAVGGTALLSNPSASEVVELPVSLIRNGELQIESGYHRQFELSELDQLFIAGSAGWKSFTFAVGLSQFGESGLFTEKLLKTSAGVHFDRFALGGSVSGLITEIGVGQGEFRSSGFGLSGIYQSTRLLFALSVDDMNSPAPYDGGVKSPPRYSGFVEYLTKGSFSLMARATMQKDQSLKLGIGQEIHLSRQSSFYWGVRSDPLMFGGGIEVGVGDGTFSYGTMVHPVLGFTHTIGFSYGWGRESRRRRTGFD